MASCTTAQVITAAMVVIIIGALLPATTWATDYVLRWELGVDYNAWSSTNSIHVGDTIVFQFSSDPPHNVRMVWDQASFDACFSFTNDAANRGRDIPDSGNGTVYFTSPGQYFFYCGMNNDCQSGMKLAINVAR